MLASFVFYYSTYNYYYSLFSSKKFQLFEGDFTNSQENLVIKIFLNQARAGLWTARAWLLEIDLVREVCVCVCVSAPEASNNQWRDMA